ncbi:uncharacterized protein LOC135824555 [Sycon ciliatum]|uniref:uncharacterized protein LOC135824555 n=1 Tax=Sycon ciliatum TaxID=27933 RepID=UPI0031F6EE01
MASAAVRRVALRARPAYLRPRQFSVARQLRVPQVSAALSHAYELNQSEGIGRTLFDKVVHTKEDTPSSWDALFPYMLNVFQIQKKSPIPLFLQLDKRGLLKGYGKCSALRYFLQENDSAMVEYCLKTMDAADYGDRVFTDVIYYLEKQGRHEEADMITKHSYQLCDSKRLFTRAPAMVEIVQRAIKRTQPFAKFDSSEWLNVAELTYLCQDFHDQSIDNSNCESRFRAKNYMTRAEFRACFEKELWLESNPTESCLFVKVDQLNITVRQANATYVGKISKFIDQLVNQFEVGMVDFIKKKQMTVRDILVHPDGMFPLGRAVHLPGLLLYKYKYSFTKSFDIYIAWWYI